MVEGFVVNNYVFMYLISEMSLIVLKIIVFFFFFFLNYMLVVILANVLRVLLSLGLMVHNEGWSTVL